jgi:cleavage and polyadenylation specificity factor subunit 1
MVCAFPLPFLFLSFNRKYSSDVDPNISDPQCECSSVELISPDTWTTVDGFEFVQNEFVNTAKSVSLETLSAESGQKDYVVIGTTVCRGEDLAVKGAVSLQILSRK